MNTALVTGTIDHAQAVALALKREGFEVCVSEGSTPDAVDGPAPGSVDCYVQLPAVASAWSSDSAGPVVAVPLLHRLDTVAAVATLLSRDAAVVLVAEEPGGDARRRALQALAEAAVAEEVGPGHRVAVVDSGDPGQIAATARREWHQARAVSLADLAPGLAYVDWRDEVMNLTSSAETTYFGWRRGDGARRAAVLRRSVLSPLPGADDGDHGLALAVLADAFGASTLKELQQWDDRLAADFFDQIISPLPAEEFELPIHKLAVWVVRRSLSDESCS